MNDTFEIRSALVDLEVANDRGDFAWGRSIEDQIAAHVDAQAAEIARLRAAEVPLSANVGFAYVSSGHVYGDALTGIFPTAYEATEVADWRLGTPVALIPLTAWDRT